MMIHAAERVLLTLWVGSLWGVGYVAAPLLFTHLDDPAAAGHAAGAMFHTVAWIGIVCGTVLAVAQWRHKIRPVAAHWRLWLVVAMVLLTFLGEFVIRPPMAEFVPPLDGTDPAADAAFYGMYRFAESLYFLNSVIALVLVAGGMQPRDA